MRRPAVGDGQAVTLTARRPHLSRPPAVPRAGRTTNLTGEIAVISGNPAIQLLDPSLAGRPPVDDGEGLPIQGDHRARGAVDERGWTLAPRGGTGVSR
jgi:hypothetical protein